MEQGRDRDIIQFDSTDDHYRLDLNGNPDRRLEFKMLADDSCLLCNNYQKEKITEDILSGVSLEEMHRRYGKPLGMTSAQVARHIALHVYPIYDKIIRENGLSAQGDGVVRIKGALKATTFTINVSSGRAPMPLPQRLKDEAPYRVMPDGIHPSKPWTEGRMRNEIEARAADSLNFLDKMREYMDKTDHVYDEVMGEGDVAKYGIAIQAIHEGRGILESIGKMGLIAKKLGEGAGGMRRLSPELQGMIEKLGIIKSDNSQFMPKLDSSSRAEAIMAEAHEVEEMAKFVFGDEEMETED